MEGIGAGRWFGVVVVAAAVLVGCGDPDQSTESGDSVPGTGDADEVVVAAVEQVLGDGPFRSRSTGQLPFLSDQIWNRCTSSQAMTCSTSRSPTASVQPR